MIKVWRLCQAVHQSTAFSGDGARRYAGRWHHKGQAVVYTAATLSLAALEVLVHADTDLAPNNFVAFAVEIPAGINISEITQSALPQSWREDYPPEACRLLGSRWLAENHTAVLAVPSAVIPVESNYILNPLHPDFSKLKIHAAAPFSFDGRLWR